MTEVHIGIERLSDLYDNEITTQEERDELLEHINGCPVCKNEYERLRSSISLCVGLRHYVVCDPNLPLRVMDVIKWRSRKRRIFKFIPAAAASFVLAAGGVTLLYQTFSEPSVQRPAVNTNAATETENLITILSDNKASILNVSDLFIDGEIPASRFHQLRRALAYKKFFYSASVQQPSASSGRNPLVEEVGNISIDHSAEYISGQEYVRFRVFK
jgi:anti-sigma factor RsiW